MLRRLLIAVALLAIAAALWLAYIPHRAPADLERFTRWFNDSASSVRVVVLLSPT